MGNAIVREMSTSSNDAHDESESPDVDEAEKHKAEHKLVDRIRRKWRIGPRLR